MSRRGEGRSGASQYTAARQALQRALAINPESTYAQGNLATLELLQGHAQTALVMFRQSKDTFRPYGIAMAEHSLVHARESQQALDALIADYAHDSAMQIAEVYAWRGEKEKAFQWLERAYVQHDGGISDLIVDPMLVSLHKDPRFDALARRIGVRPKRVCPEHWATLTASKWGSRTQLITSPYHLFRQRRRLPAKLQSLCDR